MNEKLTPEEIKLASKYINRYERDIKLMKFGRWIILIFSLALISSSFYLLTQAQKVGNMNSPEYILKDKKLESDILDRYIDARLEGKKLKTDILNKYIDARIDLLRIEYGMALKSYIGAIMGCLALGLFIASWSRSGLDRLIVKGLRMLIALSKDDEKD